MHCKINVLELTEVERRESSHKSLIKLLICMVFGDPCAFSDLQGNRPNVLNLSREKFNGVMNFRVVQHYL